MHELSQFIQTTGFLNVTWGNLVMIISGMIFIYLGVAKEFEPLLLIPIGFGIIVGNMPGVSQQGLGVMNEGSVLNYLYFGVNKSIYPSLIFLGIGAMTDFSTLIANPRLILLGAAAQFGIFMTMIFAVLLGYDLREAASIGIIGAADGPTSIVVATRFAPNLLGPISVAAYSYMALVPIIQPPVIRLLTSKKERQIRMTSAGNYNMKISKTSLILFPIVVTIVAGIIAPSSLPLIGFLMFGNLIRECGVLNKLSLAAQNELASLVTILLGITIASTMTAERFVRLDTLFIIALGLFAFVFDTFGGVIFAKFMNLFRKEGNKINPMIGACGISAFPMSARVIHQMGQKEDPYNYLLMPAISANVGGQIGSVIVGGIILTLVPLFA